MRIGADLVPTARTLDEIADSIRSHWSATEDDRFAIGRDLAEARERFPSNQEFGAWFNVQGFPFAHEMARLTRLAAENEQEVRGVLANQLASGRSTNFYEAVRTVLHPPAEAVQPDAPRGRPIPSRYPLWWREVGIRRRSRSSWPAWGPR